MDGSISQEAFAGFQQRLRLEPELEKSYGEYALLHHSLCEEFEGRLITGKPVPVSRRNLPAAVVWFAAAAAAAVALLAVLFYRRGAKPAPLIAAVSCSADAVWLSAGEAGRVSGADGIEPFTADGSRFSKGLGHFEPIVAGPFIKAEWRADYGNPSISGDRIDGMNYSVFLALPTTLPDGLRPVVLVTLEAGRPSNGEFHTDGWAGVSFFNKGTEVIFFGDSYGPERTWSLDVKQRVPIILPGNLVVGPRTVTLRYDRKSGEVTLHEGGVPLGSAFCSGKLPPGTMFDQNRINASSNAALAVRSLTVQVGGDRQCPF